MRLISILIDNREINYILIMQINKKNLGNYKINI